MGMLLGYLITWTTYGTWVQGDERGYVKDGKVLGKNERLQKANKIMQKGKTVRLTKQQREIVREAIMSEGKGLKQTIHALAVCSDHVLHIVVNSIDETAGKVAGRYKKAATAALRETGFIGRLWSKGHDKRYCFDEESFRNRIAYVQRH